MYKNPDGTESTTFHDWIALWKAFLDPIEEATGLLVVSFADDVVFTKLDEAKYIALPLWFVEILSEALKKPSLKYTIGYWEK